MGKDCVRLVDFGLMARIAKAALPELAEIAEERRADFGEYALVISGIQKDIPFKERMESLIGAGESIAGIKDDFVVELCSRSQTLVVDYWGCYVEVFAAAGPKGAVSDIAIFPHRLQISSLYLLPEHVDRMVASLTAHAGELRVMTSREVDELRRWRDLSFADESNRVEYLLGC